MHQSQPMQARASAAERDGRPRLGKPLRILHIQRMSTDTIDLRARRNRAMNTLHTWLLGGRQPAASRRHRLGLRRRRRHRLRRDLRRRLDGPGAPRQPADGAAMYKARARQPRRISGRHRDRRGACPPRRPARRAEALCHPVEDDERLRGRPARRLRPSPSPTRWRASFRRANSPACSRTRSATSRMRM